MVVDYKFKRHATRKRIGDHEHYPISGKNPEAHYGNEHFAIYPSNCKNHQFCYTKRDWVLDPFMGRGTTGIVSAILGLNFTGIDLYPEKLLKQNKISQRLSMVSSL